ncbi:MAG: MmcQ/YjbR family DNA-binding protein [Xanthomonadales bacterium]|nr:MmcQ/YjbR family DNA-binding protein [Xanthomonadales bacterium]
MPETTAEDLVASATWRAGKRPFVRGRFADDRLRLMFLVGVEQQSFMLDDPRYTAPPSYGPSGWVEVDVQDRISWEEIEALIDTAFRQVALNRMLKALDAPTPGSLETQRGSSVA